MTSWLLYIKLTLVFLLTGASALPNSNNFLGHDTTAKEGLIVHMSKFSNQPAVLMRDTSLSGNRFDYWWHTGPDLNGGVSPENYLLSAYLIDSTISVKCDSILANSSNSPHVKFTSGPKQDMAKLVKNCIRLYIGYIDNDNNLNVVVQLVSPAEFKRYKHICKKELFLVVPQRHLHVAIIQIKPGEYRETCRT